jgi:Tfp pilus assembly protein PilF
LKIDPAYARAWAGLAGVYYVARDVNEVISANDLGKWREAVDRALELGPNLAEAHARAAQYYRETGNARAAEEHFSRAMTLNPSDALVLGASAGAAVLEGRLDEAVSLQRRAVEVDPLSAISRGNLGVHLMAVAPGGGGERTQKG